MPREFNPEALTGGKDERSLPKVVDDLGPQRCSQAKRDYRGSNEHDATGGSAAKKLLEGGQNAAEKRF